MERRIGLLFAIFLAALAFAALRALQFGLLQDDRLAQAAVSQQVVTQTVVAGRGDIVDRKGVELAVSEPADDVSATPYLVKDPGAVARRLAPILRRPEEDLLKALTRRDTGFVYLARQVPGGRSARVRRLHIEGVDVTPGQRRTYPRGPMASQVLGLVGTEGKGLAGLEYRYDKVLRGRDGRRREVKDGVGEAVQVRDVQAARAGSTLELTLDAAIQDEVEEALAGIGATYRPKGATAVVMDPRSGEVLALANWPRVDANKPASAPAYASQNRAVGYTYEPGSTFKAITVAGALEAGTVTPDTSFSLASQIAVADKVIGEAHDRGAITLTTAGILAQSSNVGAVRVAQTLGSDRFDQWVRRFGFGSTSGVDLPGEERGLLLPRREYNGATLGNMAIGQGLTVTPMQMAAAYAAIANGGVLRAPHVVRRIGGRTLRKPAGRRIIGTKTATALRSMLEGVLRAGGTASEASIPGYDLAGKTGTAEKVDEATGTYSESRYVASFVGFAPARKPRLLISVMVDEPQGAIYGGQVAAPAFQKIAAFALPYLGIGPR